ncbi:hypothetical protein B9Z55_025744 [Caenorhabditis nigoni]|uniref:Uncharacterized protein n=1 Tax=Caenorhabditis nigoni TaxID=1611254 RepID=A0A2G5T052_9PELO|nr:hypothetical protein B9Z55_025744 [Caenorhabditis nigoni]
MPLTIPAAEDKDSKAAKCRKSIFFGITCVSIFFEGNTWESFHVSLKHHVSEFLSIREPLRSNIPDRQLNSFTNRYENYENAIDALFNELRGGRTSENSLYEICFLKHVVLSKNFDNHLVMAFASHLQNVLIKLTHLAATCATVRYEETKHIEQYQDEIVNKVTLIASHASMYLNNSLLSAWPSTHNGILKEQMLLNIPNPTNVDQNQLEKVANLTRLLLANKGLPNYAYEILIVREANDKYESYFNGESTRCTFNKHNSGFDTIIGRISFNSADQFEKIRLETVLEKQRAAAAEVNQTIQSEMNSLYVGPTLPIIAEALKRKIGKDILTDYEFSCWAIIREWRWIPCPGITYGVSPFEINDVESITTLRYKNRGSLTQDCEDFRFFFFV